MKLLLVAATKAEIAPFYNYFNLPDLDFVETENFDVLITGVGMVATAFALGLKLNDKYAQVINLGIAGSFDYSLPLGTVVEIVNDTFIELGAEDHDNFLSIDDLGFGQSSYSSTFNLNLGLIHVNSVTVNKVTGCENSIKQILSLKIIETESMEGAAVFYACNKLNIPCAQVRSISNYIEKRDRAKWNIGLAVKNLNDWAISFISDMN
jgi:futalosine hydrolase